MVAHCVWDAEERFDFYTPDCFNGNGEAKRMRTYRAKIKQGE